MSWKLDESEPMSPEVEQYYRKIIEMFVRATEEIGLQRTLSIARQLLQEDLKMRRQEADEADLALKNTIELIEKLKA